MKALLIEEPGKIAIKDIKSTEVSRGEILVKLSYVGFCGSDLSSYLGKNPLVRYPRVPGHEISGRIMELGEGVPKGFEVGELVTAVPYTNCGQCPSCRAGRANACQNNQTLGVQRDGAMKEFISLPWQKIIKAPGLNALQLTLVEPLTVGFHAIGRGRVTDTDVVMVLGCGMIGAGAIIRAAQRGATVIAVDVDDSKLELARKLGAHHTLNSMKSDLHNEMLRLCQGDGPDVVVEAVGNPVTYRAAVDEVAFAGRVVCIGYAAQEVSFSTKLFVQKEIDILGSRNATANDFRAVISYLLGGKFPLEEMLTRRVRMEEAAEAVKEWSESPGGVMKILLEL